MSAPTIGRQGRPVRDADPERNAAYWQRIDRLVEAAPPLTASQRAAIRVAFQQPPTGRPEPAPGLGWPANRLEAS